MSNFIAGLVAIWPWWTGPLLAAWWVALVEAAKAAPENDPLRPARGCVTALTLMVTVVWTIGFLVWLGGLS